MSTLDFLPATVDIKARPGDDISWRVIISDATGGLLDLGGATVTVAVGGESPTVDVTDPGIIDISLTDTQTSSIGAASVSWSLKVTVGSSTTTYVTGNFTGTTVGNVSKQLVAGVMCTTAAAYVQVLASGGGTGGGGGGASDLDDLTDVVITAAASGDILRHNGTAWVDTPGLTHFEAAGAVAAHEADTTSVHGISNTANLISTGTALGGVLGGTLPNPSFAADMATQAELDAHTGDSSDAHDASAISVADTGGNYTATDVEGVLAEIAPQLGGGSGVTYSQDDPPGSPSNGETWFEEDTGKYYVRTAGNWVEIGGGAATGDLVSTNNLSDLTNAGTARTNLGLGTIATQNSNNVTITGGAISGITDLPVADGGTGASTAANARTNLSAQQTLSGLSLSDVGTPASGDLVLLQDASDSNNLKVAQFSEFGGGGGGGDVATDAIFDAKGDLPVGTGSNTAAKLTVGSNGTRPVADSGQATGIAWTALTRAEVNSVMWGGLPASTAPPAHWTMSYNHVGGTTLYLRVAAGYTASATKLRVRVGTSDGNICAAVYPGGSLAIGSASRSETTGSIACPASGVADLTLGGAVNVMAGDWIGFGADGATATFGAVSSPADSSANTFGAGWQYREVVFPAPATANASGAFWYSSFIVVAHP